MSRRCRSWGGPHHAYLVHCSLCDRVAVYHWTRTYPDLLLCRRCLRDFPEAQEAAATAVRSVVEKNDHLGTRTA